ncbi:MAG: hypothetical protein RBU27_11365 [Bacteroidota bacterium]|jgi:hypothetical protein|nr:hypothetical protein [Bacteroidota bacterium]
MPTRFALSLLVTAVVVLSACSSEGSGDLDMTPPNIKIYNVENARIVYEYGGAASGSKTHIIANYGRYQSQLDKMSFEMSGMKQDVHQLDLISDTTQYTINLDTKEGTRAHYDLSRIEAMAADFTEEEKKNFQEAFLLRSQAVKIGKDTVLDKECDLYELPMMGMRISLWNGLTLRSSITMGEQELTMTAVELDDSFSPKADMFAPPKDVKLSEPKMMNGMPEGHPPVGGGDDPHGGMDGEEVSPGNPHASPGNPHAGDGSQAHPPMQGSGN